MAIETRANQFQIQPTMTEVTTYGLISGGEKNFYYRGARITPILIDYRNGLDSNLYELRLKSDLHQQASVAVVYGETPDGGTIFFKRICLDESAMPILAIVDRDDFDKNSDPIYEISDITKELLKLEERAERGSQRMRVRDFGRSQEDKRKIKKVLEKRTNKIINAWMVNED